MGAWGVGILDNDIALDWLSKVKDNPSKDAIDASLSAGLGITGNHPDDQDLACEALVAAEIVATRKGKPFGERDHEWQEWVDRSFPVADTAWVALAIRAIQRIEDVASLAVKLVPEHDRRDSLDWLSTISDLKQRLSSTQQE